ncbi:AIPR family protein [bacterium]|nr:AIPR family protein [bacterium]
MNKKLFLDGFIDRISTQFSLSSDLSFEILSIAAFLDMTFNEVIDNASTIVHKSGGHDGGIDGVYLDEDEHECILHVFQIKHSGDVGDNVLSKFVNDYRNIFVLDNAANIPLNEKIQTALANYRSAVMSGKVVETKLYFVFNGEITSQNRPLIKRHEEGSEYLRVYDSLDLYERIDDLLMEHKKRKDVRFSFMAEKSNISLKHDPQALISFQIQNIKAINFRLSALELCKLLDVEYEINRRVDTVFSENIRGFLRYNKTNRKIRETLESDYAEYFPFLNNGITIVAEQVKIPREMQAGFYPVEAKNPVIVNGLQTTHVIYETYKKNPQQLDGVFVLIRLYETSEQDVLSRITDATNTQSPINFRDKVSNKDFNSYARALFQMRGIGYFTKRGEGFDTQSALQMKSSVHSDIVLKFWYATFEELPEVAKNAKSKVLEEIFEASQSENHRLFRLFNGDKDSPVYQQLFRAYQMYTFVTQKRNDVDRTQIDDSVYYADELLTYGLYKLGANETEFEEAYQKVYMAIVEIVTREKAALSARGISYSHNSYFKSAKSRFDLNTQMGFIEKELVTEGLM